jgi:hypothetical protein
MKQRLLYSFPARLAFLIGAGVVAGLILLVQNTRRIPSEIRRALS